MMRVMCRSGAYNLHNEIRKVEIDGRRPNWHCHMYAIPLLVHELAPHLDAQELFIKDRKTQRAVSLMSAR